MTEHFDPKIGFGFYISEDADPGSQVSLRMMALFEKHKAFFLQAEEQVNVKDPALYATEEQVTTILADLITTRDDVNAIYERELAKNAARVNTDDFSEALVHLDGIRMDLLRIQAERKTQPSPRTEH